MAKLKPWLCGSMNDGVSPVPPKLQDSFDRRGVGSTCCESEEFIVFASIEDTGTPVVLRIVSKLSLCLFCAVQGAIYLGSTAGASSLGAVTPAPASGISAADTFCTTPENLDLKSS